MFEATGRAGAGTLLYSSSIGAYSPRINPDPVDESYPTDGSPLTAYTREKAYVERLLDLFETHHPEVRTVRFYTEAFGLEYDQTIASFQFGAWETDSFFLLKLDESAGIGGGFGPAMFGLHVDDLDAAHAAALKAGAVLVKAPFETDYAPRRSVVADPSGNRISLTQRLPSAPEEA